MIDRRVKIYIFTFIGLLMFVSFLSVGLSSFYFLKTRYNHVKQLKNEIKGLDLSYTMIDLLENVGIYRGASINYRQDKNFFGTLMNDTQYKIYKDFEILKRSGYSVEDLYYKWQNFSVNSKYLPNYDLLAFYDIFVYNLMQNITNIYYNNYLYQDKDISNLFYFMFVKMTQLFDYIGLISASYSNNADDNILNIQKFYYIYRYYNFANDVKNDKECGISCQKFIKLTNSFIQNRENTNFTFVKATKILNYGYSLEKNKIVYAKTYLHKKLQKAYLKFYTFLMLDIIGISLIIMVYSYFVFITFNYIKNLNQKYNKCANDLIKDPLTSLYNRKFFNKRLEECLDIVKRYKRECGIIMFDIDNFKSVNDTYGHLIGDEILCTIAKIVSFNIRLSDYLCRYGGEEFIILALETNLENSINLAQKLRLAIEKAKYVNDIKITCSFGVTSIKPYDDKESVVKRVDDLLYQAKISGKNRVCAK